MKKTIKWFNYNLYLIGYLTCYLNDWFPPCHLFVCFIVMFIIFFALKYYDYDTILITVVSATVAGLRPVFGLRIFAGAEGSQTNREDKLAWRRHHSHSGLGQPLAIIGHCKAPSNNRVYFIPRLRPNQNWQEFQFGLICMT